MSSSRRQAGPEGLGAVADAGRKAGGGPVAGALAMTLCAAAMIASQVGGKATRDALFLSSYDVTMLPRMLIASAVFSLVVIFLVSRAMVAIGPARLVPAAFAGSALLLLGEWALAAQAPRIAAVLLYLHMAAFGAILISGFWSFVNERFDPRAAKRHVSQIAAGGALGGLLGGLLADRVGASRVLPVPVMLPLLAVLQLLCAGALAWGASRGAPLPAEAKAPQETEGSAVKGSELRALRRIPYLRDLAALVLVGTVGATLLDYVFKSQAAITYVGGRELIRFFAAFHAAVGLLTFLLQSGLSRRVLESQGLARTASTLPAAVAFSGFGALFFPGVASAAAARGLEAVLHNSLFRSSYELLFTPLPPRERRATKTIVDAGFERLGDLAGGGVVALLVLLGPAQARPAMMALAMGLGIAGLVIARRLDPGYIQALERSLRSQAKALDLAEASDKTTRFTLQTMADLDRTQILRALESKGSTTVPPDAAPHPAPAATSPADPLVAVVADLRSGSARKIRETVNRARPLDPRLAPHLIPLLARDELAAVVSDALREIAPRITGLLSDHLLDPQEDFVVRRRIPGVLAAVRTRRAADGLLDGLSDSRFEVRYRCGQALAGLRRRDASLPIDSDRVFASVQREVAVGRQVWESQLLARDPVEDGNERAAVDDFLRERASRSLDHVSTLLGLVLPEEPLRIAFRGLRTTDPQLRGTALEYLESVLPPAIREGLWPYLEDHRPRRQTDRPRGEILDDLLRSNHSIQINLAEIQRRLKER